MTYSSNFSKDGIEIGNGDVNMTYLYGLSDFFAIMFEDHSLIDKLLESTTYSAAEVYNQFLQFTSVISLTEIQQYSHSSLKLHLISSADAVPGKTNVYVLPNAPAASKYITNRPFLPTTTFEEDIDFHLEVQADGTTWVYFSQDISQAGFPSRLLADEATTQYAVWFVDAQYDKQWISKYFGNLVGLTPQSSTENFKNLVYGLFYMYVQGPTLEVISKGLNLALGIPLSRGVETVLEIRQYLETDQFLIITDSDQYLIPYGLQPSVNVGDVLTLGQELALWVEVKDYNSNGDWWINLLIPPSVIPFQPAGQNDRYATPGSHFDYLMRNYLKTHTFLVNVKVGSFQNIQAFTSLSSIISNIKPAYTSAIYIWTINGIDETVPIEETIKTYLNHHFCESFSNPINIFYRANASQTIKRDCPSFMRNSFASSNTSLVGYNTLTNGTPALFQNVTRMGFANGINTLRTNNGTERAVVRSMHTRNVHPYKPLRNIVNFSRGINAVNDSTFSYAGVPVDWLSSRLNLGGNYRVVPLYITTQWDIANKFTALNSPVPPLSQWIFNMLSPLNTTEAINDLAINSGLPPATSSSLAANFDLLFSRDAGVNYLGVTIPKSGYSTFKPASVSEVKTGDYLVGVRITDDIVGVYWVTSNFTTSVIPRIEEDTESMAMTISAPMTRGMARTLSPVYMTRNFATLDGSGNVVTNTFSDSLNTTVITRNRAGAVNPTSGNLTGVIINHRMDLK